MKTLHRNTSVVSVTVLTKRLFKLERRGRYEAALCELSPMWAEPEFRPDISGLNEREAAELLLRFGALLGFNGHSRQIDGAQERAKDILTEVRDCFLTVGDGMKAAECDNYIALCYWRTGELNEAMAWVESALSQNFELSDTRLYSFVVRSLILLSQKRYEVNTSECELLAPLFFRFGNAFLAGSYCANVGLSLKNLARLDEAQRYLELAREYHRLSAHRVYLGTAENNLAQLYKASGRFTRAHASIDAAARAFKLARDCTREGFAFDTKAMIYCAEGEYDLGLDAAATAIRILRNGENAAYLTEAMQTKFKLQLLVNDDRGAVETLIEAMEIASSKIGEEYACAIRENFRCASTERTARAAAVAAEERARAQGDLQLVLPASLAMYRDVDGIWINNSNLERFGLKKGCLAVIARGEVRRGDLAAISETETDLVSCGFYDEDFGIVCLEGADAEPRLFDSASVSILGKIIGVCHPDDGQGRMSVEPLDGSRII